MIFTPLAHDFQVQFFSGCVDPMTCRNGILCGMHPCEGIWIFRGSVQTKSAMAYYGGPFGFNTPASLFPVGNTKVTGGYKWNCKPVNGSTKCQGQLDFPWHKPGWTDVDTNFTNWLLHVANGFHSETDNANPVTGKACFVRSSHSDVHVRLDSNCLPVHHEVGGEPVETYTYMDDAYLTMLNSDTKWSRDNGIVELIPIAVVTVVDS